MNKKQLAHLGQRLLDERARVMKELGYYDESFSNTLQGSDGDLSSYSFHMADQGTDRSSFSSPRRKGGTCGT
jgi:RNA polymerase-binding transcription factor DksA